ncbi:glycosyltransferase [Pseudodesulfovibrio sp.]|uniref:glycosyltransferase n=1 Tax=Pseudodesulfovibrio sp. TaxID=2035812 RepID=UPI00261D515D|nr:glycosyltransferase [Pseudodesulfovibrio sp.]MDD3311531.1 glycosyltransferase [Pseudodesulfovibrio sp.]
MTGRKVFYHTSHYISHRTAGEANIAAMRDAGVAFVSTPEAADVIVVHDDPFFYPEWVRAHAGKRLIAYCVWETETLPASYAEQLSGFDRVWTCSPFSRNALADAGFANVDVVPHIVRVPEPSEADRERIRTLLGPDRAFRFYTVCDSVNPRKDLKGLLEIFLATFRGRTDVRLVVKQYRSFWDIESLPGVVGIRDDLSAGEMAALHGACDAYVSTHHAEAWGLSLSDAMSLGKPVIATGYSGNMFFMNEANSFPAAFTLVPVSEEMCDRLPLFTRSMRWADVDRAHFAYLMTKVARRAYPASVTENAVRDMRRFSPESVGRKMAALIESL